MRLQVANSTRDVHQAAVIACEYKHAVMARCRRPKEPAPATAFKTKGRKRIEKKEQQGALG
jgi:hypothetical protein